MTLEEMAEELTALIYIAAAGRVRIVPVIGGTRFQSPRDSLSYCTIHKIKNGETVGISLWWDGLHFHSEGEKIYGAQ